MYEVSISTEVIGDTTPKNSETNKLIIIFTIQTSFIEAKMQVKLKEKLILL